MANIMKYEKITNLDSAIEEYNSNNFDFFVGDIFGKISTTSIDSVKDCLKDIEKLIEERKKLHEFLIDDLSKHEVELNNFMGQFSQVEHRDAGIRKQIIEIKAKAIEILQSKRDELLQCWQDIAKLKEEHRLLSRELYEKQSRIDMLGSIINKK
jgi:chromosome segregation ATPase